MSNAFLGEEFRGGTFPAIFERAPLKIFFGAFTSKGSSGVENSEIMWLKIPRGDFGLGQTLLGGEP